MSNITWQTGEMEVKNPLFLDDPTPASPANLVKRQSEWWTTVATAFYFRPANLSVTKDLVHEGRHLFSSCKPPQKGMTENEHSRHVTCYSLNVYLPFRISFKTFSNKNYIFIPLPINDFPCSKFFNNFWCFFPENKNYINSYINIYIYRKNTFSDIGKQQKKIGINFIFHQFESYTYFDVAIPRFYFASGRKFKWMKLMNEKEPERTKLCNSMKCFKAFRNTGRSRIAISLYIFFCSTLNPIGEDPYEIRLHQILKEPKIY